MSSPLLLRLTLNLRTSGCGAVERAESRGAGAGWHRGHEHQRGL